MDYTEGIEHRIRTEKELLRKNLQTLETKAKALTSWKHHFRENPAMYLGGALALGFVVALSTGGKSGRSASAGRSNDRTSSAKPSVLASSIADAFDGVQVALAAIATKKAVAFLEDVIPGFSHHFPQRP